MIKTLTPEAVTPTTPLRLEVAAGLGFPDGSMTVSALRRLCVAQKLQHEIIARKYYVTLAAIEEMRSKCRVQAKDPASPSTKGQGDKPCGSSVTASKSLALAAMNMIASELKKPLPRTSSKSTTRANR